MNLRTPLAALLLTLTAALAADDPPAAKKAAPPTLDELWADLAKEEIPATRAILKMGERKDDIVPFLNKRLKPLTITAERVRELIKDLGSPNDAVATEAFETFEYFDPRLAIGLKELMAETIEEPARQRLVAALTGHSAKQMKAMDGKAVKLDSTGPDDAYNFRSEHTSWWAEIRVARLRASTGNGNQLWARAVRAIVLLEHLGTPDAQGLLERMATGHPDAAPTKAAKDALQRLAAR